MQEKEWEMFVQHLRAEMILFKDAIKETSVDIRKEGFSDFPIFVAHTDEVNIGEVIIDKNDASTTYSISASTLVEFTELGLIEEKMVEEFKFQYSDPDDYVCILLVVGEKASFIFMPYIVQNPNINPNFN